MTTTIKVLTAALLLCAVMLLAWGAFSGSQPPGRPDGAAGRGTDGPSDPPEPPPTPPKVSEVVLPEPPSGQRPPVVSDDKIVAYYPVGKKVRSVADLYAKGTGTNQGWGLQGAAHFVYQARAAVETVVVESTEDSVTFRQQFVEVSQTRAVSHETLQLKFPDSPVIDIIWQQLQAGALIHPYGRAIITAKELALTADPHLKKSLTAFYHLLRRNGREIPFDEPMELEVNVNKLTGTEIEFEYVSGLGVTRVKVVQGPEFPQPMLEQLGYNAALFLDYFIGQAQEKSVGEKLTVRSQDVAGIAYFGYDVDTRGELEFRREAANAPAGDATSTLKLSPVGGTVELSGNYAGSQRTVTAKPLSGEILFSVEDGIVSSARSTWQFSQEMFTNDHLLFKTERIRDLKLETRYHAKRIPQGAETREQGNN